MKYDPQKHHRRSIRLAEYNYTQPGAYFITIVTWQRECIFADIVGEDIQLSEVGKIAAREWSRLTSRFPFLALDEFVVMPNHVHGIIVVEGRGAAGSSQDIEPEFNPLRPYSPRARVIPDSLGAIIRAYKSSVALRYHRTRFSSGNPLWQRNYYEHIIRNDAEWERIRLYIQTNPLQWSQDRENPAGILNNAGRGAAG